MVGFAAVLVLVAAALDLIEDEQFEVVPVVLAVSALCLLILALGRRHKTYITLSIVQIGLVFAYTWSLDEQVPIRIRVTPSGYTADVGGNIRRYSLSDHSIKDASRLRPLRVGLFSGTVNQFSVTPYGATDFGRAGSTIGGLARTLRLITPRSAWKNVRISFPTAQHVPSRPVQEMSALRGSCHRNIRHEIEGTFGALCTIFDTQQSNFTISGDLMRPDGEEGVLLWNQPSRQGGILLIGMDFREAWWQPWTGRNSNRWQGPPRPWLPFPVDFVAMLQYLLRTLLPSIMLAVLLAALVMPMYALALGTLEAGRKALRLSRSRAARTSVLIEHSRHIADALGIAIAATATIVMALLATYTYQRLPTTQDDVVDLFQAKTLALGRIWVPMPANGAFFQQWSMLDIHGQWFGKYPPGWPLVLSLGVLARTPWLVDPVVSGLGILLIYLIGRKVYGPRVGLLAELLAATSPFILYLGSAYYAQPTEWLFLGVFVYVVLAWFDRNRPTRRRRIQPGFGNSPWLLLIAGLAVGFAVVTRQLDAVAFVAPFLLLLIIRPLAVIWLAVGSSVPGALFGAYNYVLTGSWLPSGYQLTSTWDRPGFGKDVGGPPHTFFANFTPAVSLSNITIELENFHLALFGWPYLLGIALVALPFMCARARAWDWLLGAAALSVVGAYFFFWWPGIDQSSFPRYWYLVVPCAALLAARGVQELYRLPLRFSALRRRSRVAALFAPACLIAICTVFSFTEYTRGLNADIARWNRHDSAPVEAVQRAGIHHAIVFQVGNVDGWGAYGCVFDQNSPIIHSSSIIWAHDRGGYDDRLMRQFPTRSFYRLNGAVLTPLSPTNDGKKPSYVKPFSGSQQCGTEVKPAVPTTSPVGGTSPGRLRAE